jgi:hypothetical protein
MISGPLEDFDFDDNALAATLRAERERRADESWKPLADLRVQIVCVIFGEQLVFMEVGGQKPRGSIAGAVLRRKARHATTSNSFDLLPHPHRQFVLYASG